MRGLNYDSEAHKNIKTLTAFVEDFGATLAQIRFLLVAGRCCSCCRCGRIGCVCVDEHIRRISWVFAETESGAMILNKNYFDQRCTCCTFCGVCSISFATFVFSAATFVAEEYFFATSVPKISFLKKN